MVMTVSEVLRVDAVLGSSADADWAARLRAARVDVVRVGRADAQKSRLKTKTSEGTDVVISLDRGTRLRDGDVLHWDGRSRTAVVARVDLGQVMVIDLSGLAARPVSEALSEGVALGHALGNQHWPAVVRGLKVYVPLAIAREVMTSMMKTHDFPGITYGFAPGAEVADALTPGQARRLFGAASGHDHGAADR
jgi:urease accessory protein